MKDSTQSQIKKLNNDLTQILRLMLIAKKFQQKEAALSLAHETIMASTQVVLNDMLERVPPEYKNGFLAGCKYNELTKSKLI